MGLQMFWRAIAVGLCVLSLSASEILAAPPTGAVELGTSALFQASVKGKTVLCGNIPPWSFGRMTQSHFYPAKTEIAALKKKLKKAKSSAEKKKLQTKITKLSSSLKNAKSICAKGPPQQVTPVPTTPPSGGNSMFDSQGNVTSLGKMMFQIPASMSANVSRGISTWNGTCRGCHSGFPSGLSIRTYPAILARIQLSPMSFSIPQEVTEQQIADVTAFANY